MIVTDEILRINFLLKQISLVENDLTNKPFSEFEKSDLLVMSVFVYYFVRIC